MPSYDAAREATVGSPRARWWLGLYVLVAAIALAELAILVRAVVPATDPAYRAFFIDKTTTCLERQVPATYTAGETVSFLPDGWEAARAISVCGWSGPAGDGTHSLGTSSRLRVEMSPPPGDLTLSLEMSAASDTRQRVNVLANGIGIGGFTLTSREPGMHDLRLPADILSGRAMLDITLAYPDAFLPNPRISETRRRAVKLQSFRVGG